MFIWHILKMRKKGRNILDQCSFCEQKSPTNDFFESFFAWSCTIEIWQKKIFETITSQISRCFSKTIKQKCIFYFCIFTLERKISNKNRGKLWHSSIKDFNKIVVTTLRENRGVLLLMKEGSLYSKLIFERSNLKYQQFFFPKPIEFLYSSLPVTLLYK